jgi:hypothetical protein
MKAGKWTDLVSGNIVQLDTEDNNVVCVLSGDRKPFGMVVNTDLKYGFISVLTGTAIIQLDVFEPDEKYKSGDLLYSNGFGILTSRKPNPNSILLGSVIDGPSEDRKYIEIGLI